MELLLLVLFGHVRLIGLGVADLIEVIGDDLDDTLLSLESMRSHAHLRLKNDSRLRADGKFQCVVAAERKKKELEAQDCLPNLNLGRILEGF